MSNLTAAQLTALEAQYASLLAQVDPEVPVTQY